MKGKKPEQSVIVDIKGPKNSEDVVLMKRLTTLWWFLYNVVIFEETTVTLRPKTNLSFALSDAAHNSTHTQQVNGTYLAHAALWRRRFAAITAGFCPTLKKKSNHSKPPWRCSV